MKPTGIAGMMGFVAGVAAAAWLLVPLKDAGLLPGLALALLLLLALRWWRAALVVAGLFWGCLYGQAALEHQLAPELAGKEWLVEGRIKGLPKRKGEVWRFEFQVERVVRRPGGLDDIVKTAPEQLRLSWYTGAVTLRGDERWQLRVRLKPPHGLANPGGFDYEHWLFRRGVDATGYVRGGRDNRRLEAGRGWHVTTWRDRLSDRLMQLTPGSAGPFLAALGVGDSRHLSPAAWQVLRDTGTLHLMVISGLHIGLVAGLGFLLGRGLIGLASVVGARRAIRLQSLLPVSVALSAALVYAGLAGFSLPTQRALAMVTVVLISQVLAREAGWLWRWTLALVVVVALDPLAFWAPGFWLSFGAVAWLLVWGGGGQRLGPLRRLLGAQLVLLLGLAPWLLLFFQQLAWVAPLANLVAIPLVGMLVVPLTLLLMLSILAGIGGGWVAGLVAALLELLWWLLEHLAAWPDPLPAFARPTALLLVPVIAAGLILLLARRTPGGWLALVLLLPLFIPVRDVLSDGEYRVRVLDVGQGQAVMVETRRHRLLYDTGGRWGGGGTAAESVILPVLGGLGIQGFDTLVVSHGDTDHAGGVAPLVARLEFGLMLGSGEALLEEVPGMLPCLSDVSWRWDGVEFHLLHPQRLLAAPMPGRPLRSRANLAEQSNERSCVLLVGRGAAATLLTGDISADIEAQLIGRYGTRLQAGALLASHHGSSTGNSSALLAHLQPAWVVASAGYLNRYGHPAAVVRRRVARHGAELLTTGEQGMIEIRATPGKPLRLATYRRTLAPYWRRVKPAPVP